MKAQSDKVGIAVIKLQRLFEQGLSDRDFRKEAKVILNLLVAERTYDKVLYIRKLEEEVKDYRTLKKLLK
jgi:hypothetical protein